MCSVTKKYWGPYYDRGIIPDIENSEDAPTKAEFLPVFYIILCVSGLVKERSGLIMANIYI